MISESLKTYILAAEEYARQSFGTTTLVHVLLALLDDVEVRGVIAACGVDYLDLRQEAMDALVERMAVDRVEPRPGTFGENLSALVLLTLNGATSKAAAEGRLEATALDFLCATVEVHDNGSFDFHARVILTHAGLAGSTLAKAARLIRRGAGGGASEAKSGEAGEFRAPVREGVPDEGSLDKARSQLDAVVARATAGTKDKTSSLALYAVDLTEAARSGKLDRAFGRDAVVSSLELVLMRRRKANAVLVGDPGVGKTSVVEELACRIAEGTAAPAFSGVSIHALDVGALVAGTRYRGDFEERLKALLDGLRGHRERIIFIDEMHVLLSASHSAGAAADLLKPALASGEIRCIGATTFAEYKRYFRSDGAFSRRFEPISVPEPTRDETVAILERAAPVYGAHHGLRFTRETIEAVVDLAIETIPERRLPDKAIDMLDDVGARAAAAGEAVAEVGAVLSLVRKARLPPPTELAREITRSWSGHRPAAEALARAVCRNALAAAAGAGRAAIVLSGPRDAEKDTLAEALAAASSKALETVDLGEFADRTDATRLFGAPPGYVGFDAGGLFYDMAKRSPQGILYFAQSGKAHPSVLGRIRECVRTGKVSDSTGQTAGLSGMQVIFGVDVDGERRGLGFGRAGGGAVDAEIGVEALEGLEIVRLRSADASEREEATARRMQGLVHAARSAGANMRIEDGLCAAIAAMLDGHHPGSFKTLVETPVLDYVVDIGGDFVVTAGNRTVRITKDEAH
jgi:ATP-dependent Clp protease ATP-binding subunit ClpA